MRIAVVIVLFALTAAACSPAATGPRAGSVTSPSTPIASATPDPSDAQTGSTTGENRLPRAAREPQPLEPGTYLSPEGFEPEMSVTVPEGWYGGGGPKGFGVGQGLDLVNQRFRDVGLHIDPIDMPFQDAVAAFQEVQGLHDLEPAPGTLDGYEAVIFKARAVGEPVLLRDALGAAIDIGPQPGQQIFVDADGTTVLVRSEIYRHKAEPELDRVIASLKFPR